MPARPRADDRQPRRFAGRLGRRPLYRPAQGARRGGVVTDGGFPRHQRRAPHRTAGLPSPRQLAAQPDRAPAGRPAAADRLRRRRRSIPATSWSATATPCW
jgi:hypothetical protein